MMELTNILLLLLGSTIHLLGTLAEESKSVKRRISLIEYSNKYPYQIALGFGLSVAAYFLMEQAGQLNPAMAFTCGYMGDSIIKKFTNSTAIGKKDHIYD